MVVNGETQKAKPCTHSTEDLQRQLESGLARDLRERQPRFLKRVRGEIEHREQSLGGTADGPLEKIGIDNPEALYPPHLSLAVSPPPPPPRFFHSCFSRGLESMLLCPDCFAPRTANVGCGISSGLYGLCVGMSEAQSRAQLETRVV